jgi:hypothetical protein
VNKGILIALVSALGLGSATSLPRLSEEARSGMFSALPPPHLALTRPNDVPYSCAFIQSGDADADGNFPTIEWPNELNLVSTVARTMQSDSPAEFLQLLDASPRPRDAAALVSVQHELYEIGVALLAEVSSSALRKQIADRIAAYAPDDAAIASWDDLDSELTRSLRIPRFTSRRAQLCGVGPLVHESITRGAFAFRPLRYGELRVLAAHMIAFDRSGRAHVSPFIAHAELRHGGDEGAPACLVKRTILQGEVALLPVAPDEARFPPFVQVRNTLDGPAAGCANCHTKNGIHVEDVTLSADVAKLERSRSGHVERLAEETLALMKQ